MGRRATGFIRKKNGRPTSNFNSFEAYLNKMQSMTASQLVDIMLMSASSAERLFKKRIFKNSPVIPAIRLNDTSCIWDMIRYGNYAKYKSRPFSTIQLKKVIKFANLGLYSLTFSNDVDLDIKNVE